MPAAPRVESASPSESDTHPTGFGFPRRYRLTQPSQFQSVLRSPAYVVRRGALRIVANANTMHGARLGLIVGKRAVRAANRRNLVKRVVRETFRQARPGLPALDVVVQVRPNDGDLSAGRIALWTREALTELTRRVEAS